MIRPKLLFENFPRFSVTCIYIIDVCVEHSSLKFHEFGKFQRNLKQTTIIIIIIGYTVIIIVLIMIDRYRYMCMYA